MKKINAVHQALFFALSLISTAPTSAPAATTEAATKEPVAAPFTNVTATQIQANWTDTKNTPLLTTYTAILSTAASPSTNHAAGNVTKQTTAQSVVFTGLTPNTAYFVEVKASDLKGDSKFISLPSVATLANPPTSASPTDIQTDAITAHWDANGNPPDTSYTAEASADSQFGTKQIRTTTSLSATFDGLASNTTYYMRVQAINRKGSLTSFTLLPTATTLGDATGNSPAPIPAGISNVQTTQLQANWTPNGNPPGTSYIAVLSTAPKPGTNQAAGNRSMTTTGLFAVFTGLSVNEFYYVDVKAMNGGKSSAYASLGSAVTLANLPMPKSPSNIQTNQITANWGANGNPTGTSYLVRLSLESDFDPLIDSDVTPNTSSTFSGLSPNTTYYMQVLAINHSAQQTDPVVLPPAQTFIEAPSDPVLTPAQSTDASILWTWPSVDNATGYRVISDKGNNLSGDLDSSQLQWLENNLAINTGYSRQLIVFNASGNSTSTLVTGYTLAHQPTGLAISTPTPNSVMLTWNANGNPISTQYVAQATKTSGSGLPFLLTVQALKATFSELDGDTTYFITVRAVNGAGTAADAGNQLTVYMPPQIVAFHQICPTGDSVLAFNSPRGPVRVEVPAGAFESCVQMTVKIPGTFPDAPASGTPLQATGVGLEVTNDLQLQPRVPLTIGVPFKNTEIPPDQRSRLVLARYDEEHQVWVMLPSTVDPDQPVVRAKADHLSLYQIMISVPATGLSGVRVYPNPFRPSKAHTAVTFSDLPADAGIQIFTLSGEKVADLSSAPTGNATWDGRNSGGQPVASGIYFAVVKSGGDKKIVKVAVQR